MHEHFLNWHKDCCVIRKLLALAGFGFIRRRGPGMKRNAESVFYPGNFLEETIVQMDESRVLHLWL